MKKTLSIITITLLILLISISNVQAAGPYKVTMSTEATAAQGGEITVTVKLSDFANGTVVEEFAAVLQYDKAIFEVVKESDITTLGGWSKGAFNENEPNTNGFMINVSNPNYASSNTDIFSFKLKVKPDAKLGSTTLTLSDFDSTDGVNLLIPDTEPTTITIQAASVATPEPTATTTPKTTAKATTPTPTAKSNESMPKTGVEDYIMPAIVIVAVIGIFAYVRFNKMDK